MQVSEAQYCKGFQKAFYWKCKAGAGCLIAVLAGAVCAGSRAASQPVSGEAGTITLASPAGQAGLLTPLTLFATGSSGLAASFASSTPGICTVSGTGATFVSGAICTIHATQASNGAYRTASTVPQGFMVSKKDQTISFPPIPSQILGGALALTATASSGLPITFSSTTPAVCSVSGNKAAFLSTGTCSIDATQGGDATYAAAPAVGNSFIVKASQTIDFPAITSTEYAGSRVALAATASSGLVVTFSSTTSAVCTVSGRTALLLTAGICAVEASQSGNSIYGAAAPVIRSLTVSPKKSQTITFANPGGQTELTPLKLLATSSSGLPINFASTTTQVCTVSGTTATFIAAGTCSIDATQRGDATYAAAPAVGNSFIVKASQTIDFPAITSTEYAGSTVALAATASSGLVVAFSSTTSAVCTVSGRTVLLLTAATCTVQASQSGNSIYGAAAPVTRSLIVSAKKSQTITFANPGGQTALTPLKLLATSSSGLPIGFASITTQVCTVSGTTATFITSGTCTIDATQGGDSTYAIAATIPQNFAVRKASQTIAFSGIQSTGYVGSEASLPGTANSGLAVTFSSNTTSVCTVSGSTGFLLQAGTCTIQATQSGNSTYGAATPVTQSLAVSNKMNQTIGFASIPHQTEGTTLALVAAASSGMPVTFRATTPAICSVSGNTAKFLAAGVCSIDATQAGNYAYLAMTVGNSFDVNGESQTIRFPPIPTELAGANLSLAPLATSGLPVTLTSLTPAVCSLSGDEASMLATGTCTIEATQPGNGAYASASAVLRSFLVQATQTITYTPISLQGIGTTLQLVATASSGLAVTLTSTTPKVCAVSGSTASFIATGSCSIDFLQAGDSTYAPAPAVGTSFTVVPSQTITFLPITATQYLASSTALSATASSGLPVFFTSTTPLVCTVSGNTAFLVADGECTVQAAQSGNKSYAPATPVFESFTVNPTVVISPNAYSFTNYQVVGSRSAAASFTMTNSLATDVTISGIAISDPQFSQTNDCGNSLAAGARCRISVVFTPQSNGAASATLSVTDSTKNSPHAASLKGFGFGMVTVLPAAYFFPGSQAVGTSSAPVSLTVSNSLAVTVKISSIAISNSRFTQTNNCGDSLASGASCTILVSSTPNTVGRTSAVLSVTDSASGSPQTVSLVGFGSGSLAFSPSSLTFVPQIIGRPSTPQLIHVTNTQSTFVTLSSITSVGPQFSVSNDCIPGGGGDGTLAPGASCAISVTFHPSVTGLINASVSVANNAAGSPEVLSLNGFGEVGDTGVGLSIIPQSTCILPSGTQQFSAPVLNSSDTDVTWYVDGVEHGNSLYGAMSAKGLYSAPSSAGKHTIEAISNADTGALASTTINVTQEPTLGIFPATSSIPVSSQQNFQGQICSVPDDNVTWSVDNIPGGNAKVGTIGATGTYRAPSVQGEHTIEATDTVTESSTTAVVQVYPSLNVDFGSRTDTQYPIAPGVLGINTAGSLFNSADIGLVTDSGITLTRANAFMDSIYANPNPDWSQIDPQIAGLQAAGMQALLVLYKTPAWLQAIPNPCAMINDSGELPAVDSLWAKMAAEIVAHMDSKFPGVVAGYEIWNEPNGQLCGPSALEGYLALYAAAAPAIKEQASHDGISVRVGGPATAGLDASWISGLVSNPSTAPYVDFVSYHNYIGGNSNLWDTYNGIVPLYQATQQDQPSNYLSAAALVSAGSQPGGANTPIYVDEYNTTAEYAQTCCQNHPIHAPVWNALYVSDMLDAAYSGKAQVPAELGYFAATAYPYFCLIGTWDADMDCQYEPGSSPAPYPQYYAYQLMSASQYLGLNSGGYLAPAVTPGDGGGGPVIAAFYTPNKDSILIVNPTSIGYSQVPITLQNVGFARPAATLFQIVSPVPESDDAITSTSLPLNKTGADFTTTVSLPPYSVMGITIE